MAEREPRHVAYFSPGWPPGRCANGIVTYVGCMREGLAALGVATSVVAGDDVPADEGRRLFALRGPEGEGWWQTAEHRLLSRLDPGWAGARRSGRALRSVLRRLGRGAQPPELFEIEESLGLGAWALDAGLPTVVRLHGPWFLNGSALGVPEDAAFRRRDRREGRLLARARAISAPSRDVLERTRSHFQLELRGARVIPNPVPEPRRLWSREGADPATILFVGRFDRHKGGDLVVDAFASLASRHPQLRLVFVGPDRGLRDDTGRVWTLPAYLAHRLPEADARRRVEVTGEQPREAIEDLRTRASVVVVPSRYEVLSMTTLEAQAAGAPVVAARAGGPAEIVEHGESGLLFQPGDAGDLAGQLERVLGSPELASRLSAGGMRAYRARHTPEAVARASLDFYAEVREAFRGEASAAARG